MWFSEQEHFVTFRHYFTKYFSLPEGKTFGVASIRKGSFVLDVCSGTTSVLKFVLLLLKNKIKQKTIFYLHVEIPQQRFINPYPLDNIFKSSY